MVTEENNVDLFKTISKEELLGVLSLFKKDKSPGRDGWNVDFFLNFFELLGDDLLWVVEEIRTLGKVPRNCNTNFIALIPKTNCPNSFKEFRLISLCNCLYKVISKILSTRLKPYFLNLYHLRNLVFWRAG
jgi:hypothetical protein